MKENGKMRIGKKTLFLVISCMVWMVLLISVAPIDQAQAVPTSYYVKGDTGLDTNPGTLASPYKTIQKCATVMLAGDTCFIRAGVYRETVTPINSGTSTNPIKFAAYNNESVTISGADLINGWTLDSGSIYKATMNWDMSDITPAGLNIRNVLFVDNAKAGEAKWPNNAPDILNTNSWAVVDSATANPATVYTITDSALSTFPANYWNGATVVGIGGVAYTSFSSQISAFSSSTITFAPWANGTSFYAPQTGDIYYITKSLKALDVANEWYKDSLTNTLYLMVPGGIMPGLNTVEARKRDYAFDLSSKSYIEVTGISLRTASVKTTLSNNLKLVSINMQGATQYLEGSFNEIRNSEISKTDESGIVLTGLGNRIINNYVHDVNYNANNAFTGIRLDGTDHLISHNTVARSAAALLVGSITSSVIQYNNIYDAAILTEDVGIIHFGNADYGNTEIHHNWIHDNKSRNSVDAMGLYLDNFSSNLIAYKNVIWNTPDDSIRVNNPYNYQLFYNNSAYNQSNLVTQIGVPGFGTQYLNNILFNGISIQPDVNLSHNFTSGDPKYVNPALNDFHLQSTSPAINKGRVITGVTEGTTPDIGAYEFGGVDWTAGHNFTTPPNPVFTLNNFDYKNKVFNYGFERGATEENHYLGSFNSWTTTGTPQLIQNASWDYRALSMANSQSNSAGLKSGDKIEKTITGLNPNTTYVLSGWGKIDGKLIQAEDYSTGSGSAHWQYRLDGTPEVFRSSTYIGPLRDGDYLSYTGIVFNNLYDRIELGLTNTKLGGSVEVRLDSTTGTLLGTLNLADYYSAWKFHDILFSSTVSGTHNLFLVFKGVGLGDIALLDVIKLKNTTMNDSIKVGVKNFNGSSDLFTSITSTGVWANGVVLFTTGASNTSATIYADKPTGNYVGYMDNLGVIQSYLPDGAIFYDSFENGLGNWTTQAGTTDLSSVQKRSGNSSYVANEDADYILHNMPGPTNKVAVVWFYDDATDVTLQSLAFVDNGTPVALGVNTGTSTNKYVNRIGNTWTASTVNRTTGWHELTFDYRSGMDVKLYIDGIQVAVSTAATSFNRILLGDIWTVIPPTMGTVYFDNISVQNSLPFIFNDGFENGFGNWTTQGGTPSTSTVQKHSGNTSYVMNEDTDAIQYNLPSSNKVAVVWFYDDATDTSMETVAFVDNGSPIGLGVLTTNAQSKYSYRIGSTWGTTPVTRTTGWHELTFDYRSGSDVKLYIDGVQVVVSTAVTSFNRIYLGDAWPNSVSGTVYFDDIVIRDDLTFVPPTPPIFSDGFENGFSPNWITQAGTPSTSTTQKRSGNFSYVLNEDLDAIVYNRPATNKVAVVWFYDDAADISMQSLAFVDYGSPIVALGVNTLTDPNKYVTRIGNTWAATGVNRSTGWHKLTFDYRSTNDVKLYIDEIQVAVSTLVTYFTRIYLGDPWGGGLTGTVYFDDITVQDSLLP